MKAKSKVIRILSGLMIVFTIGILSFWLVGSALANGTMTTLIVPDNVYRPAEFVVSSTTTNSGTAYTNVRFNITVSGPDDFTGTRADTFTITKVNGSTDTQGINDTFVLQNGDWVGYWGPAGGFPLADPYDATSTFTIEMNNTTAPLVNYDMTVELVDLTPEPDVILATATDSFSLSADALYVGTTEYQYQFTTIQSAIDAASAGDTITVAAGTYTEAVTVQPGSDLTFIGAGIDVTYWTSPSDDASRTHCLKSDLNGYSGTTTLDISGFTFSVEDNAISTNGIALYINGAKTGSLYLSVHDNKFVETTTIPDETANSMLLCHNRFAARDGGVAPVKIYNNLDYTTGGIAMSNTRAFDIYDNIFDGGSDALYIGYGCPTNTTVGDHHIYQNTFKNASNIYPDGPWPSILFSYHGSGTGMTFLPSTIDSNSFEGNDAGIGYSMESNITYPTDVIEENGFEGNVYAMQVWGTYSTTVTAESNWWGDASGPSGEGPGTGDDVSANVDYSPWWGANYVGDDHSSAWTWYTNDSIQDAIDAASAGDTINVADGTYTLTTRIMVNKGVTITGNTSNPENVIVQYSPAANSLIFDMRVSNVTVQGIKTISGKSGFFFDQGATGCKISHCIVENAQESGIYIYNGNTHTIEHTTITNPGQSGNLGYSNGVYTRADSTTIDHCTITSDKVQHMKWGVNLEAGSNHVVTETNITGAWQAGIRAASGVKPITITNNNIDDATEGYQYEAAISLAGHNDGSTVSGNHIDNVIASSAIAVYNAWDITIANNQIGVDDLLNDVRQEGIRIEGCGGSGANRVEITGNNINNTGYAAIILVNDSSNAYIYNNTITKCNNYGADSTGDWDYASVHVNDTSANVIVDSNDISDGINGIQVWGNSCTVTNNTIYNMGLTYADTKGTPGVGDGVYYNSGIIIGTNWLTNNFKPSGTTITDNKMHGNYKGLYVRDYATLSPSDPSVLSVTAEENWWGEASGPGPVGPGSGDEVSTNVNYSPWCVNADCTVFASENEDGSIQVDPGTSAEDIQTIIDSVPTGGVLVIPAGTYYPIGGFTIDTPGITIKLSDGSIIQASSPCFTISANDTTIASASVGGGKCIPTGGSHGIVVDSAVSSFEINGVEIDGTGQAAGSGVWINKAVDGLKILDNYIHDLDGDGILYSTTGLVTGDHIVRGNLFHDNSGFGVNNASALSYNVEYNSWGSYDGPSGTGGDGANGLLDFTPWTYVSLDMLSSGTPTADLVAMGGHITYTIQMNAREVYGADFDLKFDKTKLSVISITNSGKFSQADECTINSVENANTTGEISFCGERTTALNGEDQPVFDVVFLGLSPGLLPLTPDITDEGPIPLILDNTDDMFYMSPPSPSYSTNIYAGLLTDGSVIVYFPATTTTIISVNPAQLLLGQDAVVNFSVTSAWGSPTGSVMISDGVDTCTGTVAAGSCTITLTTPGARTLVAIYMGDSNFYRSTSPGVLYNVLNPVLYLPLTLR